MGDKGSSSRRKSSKRKTSKISSKVLKKKSRRKESKRRRRPSDSVSTDSSSSSESAYRRKKIKSKKHLRAHSVSSNSSDRSVSPDVESLSTYDSYDRREDPKSSIKKRSRGKYGSHTKNSASRKRKRGRLNKDLGIKSRQKSLKKSRKRLSSSDSESCSQCHGESSDTFDGKQERKKEIGRSRGRELHKDNRKRKVRSPSSSSCSRCADPVVDADRSHEALSVANNSRRLKSVIAIANQDYDENKDRWEMDPHKEEMVYDHDDYPSPKSLDSNENATRMGLGIQPHGACNKRIRVDNTDFEEVTEPIIYGFTGSDRYCPGEESQSDEVPANNSEDGKEIHTSVDNASIDEEEKKKNNTAGDDLESILRQKALNNLRRFQVGLRGGQRTTSNHIIGNENVYESSTTKVDSIQTQHKSTNQDICTSGVMDQIGKPALRKDFRNGAEAEKDSDGEHAVKESGIHKQAATHSPNGAAALVDHEEKNLVAALTVSAKPVSTSDTIQGAGSTNSCRFTTEKTPHRVLPTSVEPSLRVQQNESKDDSEFEQKTMSVMRGGEMVQVSYKVYIPKKASALARRQLRR